ncbi:hypothetical protein Aperf_G00000015341 [Anoplocephala perfoliata]
MSGTRVPENQRSPRLLPSYDELVSLYPATAPSDPSGPVHPTAPGYPQVLDQPQRPPPPYLPPPPYASQPALQPERVAFAPNPLGPMPCRFYCTSCGKEVLTDVTYESGALTWLLVVLLFICGFIFGCCLIPFFCDCDKDAWHKCPSCGTILGKYSRL